MKTLTFKIGGVHPPEMKTAESGIIIDAGLPMSVSIPLCQHKGSPAMPIVKVGEHVERGQKIGEGQGPISANVHTSISGTVKSIAPVLLAEGRMARSITITASDEDHQADLKQRATPQTPRPYASLTPAQIAAIVAEAGIVGMGGATFPTAPKLWAPSCPTPELLIINGCECEPCITCDDALMQAHPAEIIEGAKIMMQASGSPRAVIGIEANKPAAIAKLTEAAATDGRITLCALQPKYPQGSEKQLIFAITGKEVGADSLPISAGVIVQNVGTAYAVYEAVALGKPMIERVITLSGVGNYLAPIGMAISQLPAQEASTAQELDVIAGGPMMGLSTITLDAPIVKGLSGITALRPKPYAPEPCIRCGECSEACPMGLEPYLLATCARLGQTEMAREHHAMNCIECGCCSYACPSARPILDFIRLAKKRIRKENAAKS